MPSRILHRLSIIPALPILAILALSGCAPLPAQTSQPNPSREFEKLREENRQFQDAYYKIKEQLDAQTAQSQKTIDQLTRELDQAHGTRTLKEKELGDKLNATSQEYTKYKKETLDQRVMLEAQAAQLQRDLQSVTTERNNAQAALKQTTEQFQTEQAKTAAQTQQLAKFQGDMKLLGDQVAGLKKGLTDRDAAVTAEKTARAAAEKDRDTVRQQLAEQAQKLQATQTQLADAQKKAEAATQAQQAASKAQDQATQFQTSLDQAVKDRDALAKEKDALTREVADLKGKLQQAASAPKPVAAASLADDPVLKNQAAALEQRFQASSNARGVSVRLDRRGLRIIVPSALLFDNNKASLSGRAGSVLAPIAQALGQMSDRPVTVEGHTDNQPPEEPYADNWTLGFARADRVREFLMRDGGIGSSRLTALSRADNDPLASNATPEGRRQNRRVEIVVGAK